MSTGLTLPAASAEVPTSPPSTVAPTTATTAAPSTAAPSTAAPTTAAPIVAAAAAPAAPAATMAPQPTMAPAKQQKTKENEGYMVHNYVDHVTGTLGAQMLTPGQTPYATYERLNPTLIQARAPISGLRPVVEQAIATITKKNPGLSGEDLERKIANELTQLNDWENLNEATQAKMMLLSGIDIASMSKREREEKINHLLHSPVPFGDLTEVLTPDVTIDLGYTHTLDKKWTTATDLGNGVFKITMVSNNNNGSHTGHSLGSFQVQLPVGTTVQQAREVGNKMVKNKNNNDKLYLDPAARAVLYGQTPLLDFSQKPPVQPTTSTTAPASTSTTATMPSTTEGSTTSSTAESTSTTAPSTSTTAPSTSTTVMDHSHG